MVTFVDLVKGAYKVLPTSVPPRLSEVKGDIRIDSIKINNMTGVKTVVINTSMRPSGLHQKTENYPATVIFEGIEDPVYNPPSLTKDNVRVRCSCQAFYFWAIFANKKAGCLAGGRFKRYIRKTPITDPRYPPKNISNTVCLCKHLYILMEYMKYRGIAKP